MTLRGARPAMLVSAKAGRAAGFGARTGMAGRRGVWHWRPAGFRAALAVALSLAATGAAHADILIGIAGPKQGIMGVGALELTGAEKAVADLAQAGGLLGQNVELRVYDDGCDDARGAEVARRAVADGVAVMIGHSCSGASIAAAPVYAAAGIVQLTPSSTSPELTALGIGTVFRVCGRDDRQAAVAADLMLKRWRDSRIAVIDDESTYGAGLARLVVEALRAGGVEPALIRQYAGGSSPAALANALNARRIDVVYLGSYEEPAGRVVLAARERGGAQVFLGGDALGADGFLAVAGPHAEGLLYTFGADPRTMASAATVTARLRAGGFEPSGYALYGYAAVEAWAQAVTRAGTTEAKAVAAALHGGTFETVLGNIGFDADGDVTGFETFGWFRWHGGQPVTATP